MDHIYDSDSSLWLHNELSGVWILEKTLTYLSCQFLASH